MKRPGKPSGFYNLSHQATDTDCGIITAVTVTTGDVHDSRPYLEQLEYVHKNVVPIQVTAADHCLFSATALNLKKNDKAYGMTPRGVFFLTLIAASCE